MNNVFNSVKYIVLSVSTVCNLKCKNCITFTPYHHHPVFFPVSDLKADVERFFRIFGKPLERLDLGGGEPLLHPQLDEFVRWALKYQGTHFSQLRILTNGSIRIPKPLIELLKGKDAFFLIDNYGPELSPAVEYNESELQKNGIPYRINTYYGDNQYFNGWVDFGILDFKNWTSSELEQMRLNCFDIYSESEISRQHPCDHLHIKNGHICYCDIQQVGASHIPVNKGDYIDLRSGSSDEELRACLRTFKQSLIECCKYCNGFLQVLQGTRETSHGNLRIPAAIQLTKDELKNLPVECI